MAYGNNLIIGECDVCTKRSPVAEIKLSTGRVIRLCEQCLIAPHSKLVKGRKGREARDKKIDGTDPHQPYRYTQVD